MKNRTLEILLRNTSEYISGEEISKELGISRAAVWKHISLLKNEGYVFLATSKKGYKIVNAHEMLESGFYDLPQEQAIGRNYYYLDEVDSTNSYSKKIAVESPDGTVVMADVQTKGKGRLGRAWESKDKKGLWMSVILKPKIPISGVFILSHLAGVAVCKTLLEEGYNANIKWPNDVLINGKKVCGILCELDGEAERVNYVVVGIGLNLKQEIEDFPMEIREKATSLLIEDNEKIRPREILKKILLNLEYLYNTLINDGPKEIIKYAKENSATIGKDVQIIYNNDTIIGKAIDINHNGGLVIETKDGQTMEIISGEVSVRGLYGYV
jgi:BirA family biotin operon repressor/biotin-[acetyl-CoA-carboxylase] ligase